MDGEPRRTALRILGSDKFYAYVAELWRRGNYDTAAIAVTLGLATRAPAVEAEVANALARIRDQQHKTSEAA